MGPDTPFEHNVNVERPGAVGPTFPLAHWPTSQSASYGTKRSFIALGLASETQTAPLVETPIVYCINATAPYADIASASATSTTSTSAASSPVIPTPAEHPAGQTADHAAGHTADHTAESLATHPGRRRSKSKRHSRKRSRHDDEEEGDCSSND